MYYVLDVTDKCSSVNVLCGVMGHSIMLKVLVDHSEGEEGNAMERWNVMNL